MHTLFKNNTFTMDTSKKFRKAIKHKCFKSEDINQEKVFKLCDESQKYCNRIEINELPVEILTKILSFLPLRHRKIAKLVCKAWYNLCNISQFLRTEKLICCGLYDLREIIRTLSGSKCEQMNLEFLFVQFEEYPTSFWGTCGKRIYSLNFIDCILNEDTLVNMITHCINLQNLSWSYEFCKTHGKFLCSTEVIDHLLQNGIVNENLISFEIHVNKKLLTNYILNGFFTLFPKIKKLAIWCNSLDPPVHDEQALTSKDIFTFSNILNKVITSAVEIENLRLELHHHQQRNNIISETIVSVKNLTRLKEVMLELDVRKNESEKNVLDFFSKQRELESVKCHVLHGSSKEFISQFLFRLVEDCPRLRHIQLSSSTTIVIKYNTFKKLVASSLETLCIQCRKITLDPNITSKCNSQNHSLRTLCISYGMDEYVQLTFVIAFCNLKYLELHEVTDTVLQTIWKYQINLISLKLFDCEYTSNYGFIGRSDLPNEIYKEDVYSIRRLKRLEYLEIEAVTYEWNVTDDIFSEFIFPHLRYFSMNIEGNTKLYSGLFKTIESFTALEALSVSCQETSAGTWIKLCSNLNSLRYLQIGDEDEEAKKFTGLQYRSIFLHCPTLRVFVHGRRNKVEVHYYDIFQKKALRKFSKRKFRIHSEKIGVFFVNWLWF